MKLKRCILIAFLATFAMQVAAKDFLNFQEVELPVGQNAYEPSIYVTKEDQIVMSWMEDQKGQTSVNVAILSDGNWSAPSRIAVSQNIFVNWADFPSIAALSDGTLVAHWLQKSENSAYAYDIRGSLSTDNGASWGSAFQPHLDYTNSQHGFVSILPVKNTFILIWLDGRAYENELIEEGAVSGAMQLRAAIFSKNGAKQTDFPLDFMVCSCCQTSATLAGGAVLVAYRDRTTEEIRDISVRRLHNGIWSDAITVYDDEWQIYGCPVNGPSIDAFDKSVFIAWFTASNDNPKIKIAMSKDAGLTFKKIRTIPSKNPIGHVDIAMINEKTGIVSWLEWEDNKEILKICRITFYGCSKAQVVSVNSFSGSLNFPKISVTSSDFYMAWTQPLSNGNRTIRMLSAPLEK